MRVIKRNEFLKVLRQMPQNTKKPMLDALHESADEVIEYARTLAPRDTGKLKISFEKSEYHKDNASFGVSWENTDFKAHWVEHGRGGGSKLIKVRRKNSDAPFFRTITWPAASPQPFFWPAYRVLRRRIRGRVSRAVKKALKDTWKM